MYDHFFKKMFRKIMNWERKGNLNCERSSRHKLSPTDRLMTQVYPAPFIISWGINYYNYISIKYYFVTHF